MMRVLKRGMVLLKSPANSGGDRLQCLSCVRFFHVSSVNRETFYEVLGVEREATKEEIKAAYIKMTKEKHPDKLRIRADGRKRSALEAEEDHANFVKINLAYSVLSKRESRVEYDLGLAGDRLDPASNYKGETTTRYYKPANFEERANIYGYYQDPRFKYNRSTYWVAFGCILFAIVGYIIHYQIVVISFRQQRQYLDKKHLDAVQHHTEVKEFAESFGGDRIAQMKEFEARILKARDEEEKRIMQVAAQPWFGSRAVPRKSFLELQKEEEEEVKARSQDSKEDLTEITRK